MATVKGNKHIGKQHRLSRVEQIFPGAEQIKLGLTFDEFVELERKPLVRGDHPLPLAEAAEHIRQRGYAYTQFNRRGGGIMADYVAIRQVMRLIKTEFMGYRIGYPKLTNVETLRIWKYPFNEYGYSHRFGTLTFKTNPTASLLPGPIPIRKSSPVLGQ